MPRPPWRSDATRYASLTAASAAVAAVWLVVLPLVGDRPAVRSRIESNERRGINPGAMYYTELEAMGPIAARVDRVLKRSPEAFRRPSHRADRTE